MGLKDDLINAKVKAAKDIGVEEPLDTSPGSFIEREAEYTKEAIVNFLTDAKFTVTKLNAPIVLENLKTPDQIVDIKREAMKDDKQPMFKTIRQLGSLIPAPGAANSINLLMDQVEISTDNIINSRRIDGATLRGLNMSKDGRRGIMGGLQSDGYVFIGEDPESQDAFDVDDRDGQRDYTEVKLFRADIEDLL